MKHNCENIDPSRRAAIAILPYCMIAATLLFGCTQTVEKESLLLGSWQAQWKTTPQGNTDIPAEYLTMDGRITFHKNGTAYIEAFGYEQCIFSQDTLENLLRWALEDTTLRFIDKGDESGLPYAIRQMRSNRVDLVLMEDIFLTLQR